HLPGNNLVYYDNDDIAAVLASGSFQSEGMIVIPCSMSTLSAITYGSSNNLITRVADVMLKEKRQLILIPRETPLSTIHLRNMLLLSEMGVHIVPAMPGFYSKPTSIDEIVDFLVGKVLDLLNIPNDLYNRYV
ncbi:MAG TPA: aromatic acid decarboxylase, partial [Syntrophomonas sp.]|nr:aromatic acid decarboxylase [Syntrophomonas sp.]